MYARARNRPTDGAAKQAGMDDIVVHFRLGLVGLMASRWRKLGPRRAGEALTAASGFCLTACQRDEEGVGER